MEGSFDALFCIMKKYLSPDVQNSFGVTTRFVELKGWVVQVLAKLVSSSEHTRRKGFQAYYAKSLNPQESFEVSNSQSDASNSL